MAHDCFKQAYQGNIDAAIEVFGEDGDIYWLEQKGEILSMLFIRREVLNHYFIWNVCTPHDHRRKGYGRELLIKTMKHFHQKNPQITHLYLFVERGNEQARKLCT